MSLQFHLPIYLHEVPSIEFETGLVSFDTFNIIPNIKKIVIKKKTFEQDNDVDMKMKSNMLNAKNAIRTTGKMNFQVKNSIHI